MKFWRLVDEFTFKASNEQIRAWYKSGNVRVYYCPTVCSGTVQTINQLRDEILKEFPNIKEEDMHILVISEKSSSTHAKFTTIFTGIPVDDFLRLRSENKIGIL